MNTKSFVTAGVIVMSLFGCNSFNRTTFTEIQLYPAADSKANVSWPATDEQPPIERTSKKELLCPPYVFPELPPIPELPLRELAKVSPANMKALDIIQQKHIEDLRAYISKTRKIIQFSHQEYIEDCQAAAYRPAGK